MVALRIIEVALGLFFIYMLGSIIVLSINQATFAGWLANVGLRKGINDLINVNNGGHCKNTAVEEFFKQPLIRNLGDPKKITYIPPQTFVLALFSYLNVDIQNIGYQKFDINDNDPCKSELKKVINTLEFDYHNFQNIENWFNNTMDFGITQWYKMWITRVAFFCSLLIVWALNIDSIMIAREIFSKDSVSKLIENGAASFKSDTVSQVVSDMGVNDGFDKLDTAVNRTCQINYLIGWKTCSVNELRSWPQEPIEWIEKIFGLLITAIAFSLGSHYWFDLLDKVIKLSKGI
ncbi:MAG TPA: hypothetical protein VHO70_23985 [Chitinispirillaceae bacterium]|nr:hypothetical protein [Chitinispirillaceae bacterium]